MSDTRLRAARLTIALVAFAAASAGGLPTGTATGKQPEDEPSAAEVRDLASEAFDKVRNDKLAEAAPLLDRAIEAKAFTQLDAAIQHATLSVAGLVALTLDAPKKAHGLLVRSSSMADATDDDWFGRLQSAYAIGDSADSVLSLTTLAQLWPERLADLNDRAVLSTAMDAKKLPGEVRYQLLDALYRAQWKLSDEREPSWLWRDLTLMLLERNASGRAAATAARVADPYALISMRADNRFAAVDQANPLLGDIEDALARELARLRSAVQKNPRLLEPQVQLTYSLLSARKYGEVMELADAAIARNAAASKESRAYDDVDTEMIWIMDSRSRALRRMGRWDEAVEQLKVTSQKPEQGRPNVSQAINLGELYCSLDRATEALAALADVKDVSPYGRMQVEAVRLMASVRLQDQAAVDSALAYLREHQEDAVNTFQWSLVHANRIDEASELLIARLADRELRGDALLQLQTYVVPVQTALEIEWRQRWNTVVERPAVQSAIRQVGKVEKYGIEEQ